MDLTATWYATAAAAWGCYLFGVACFRMANGDKLFLGVAKAAIVTCPVVLSCFGVHATRRVEFILAATRIPLVEVANSDNGRERIIERIDDGTGITIEREHIAGWSLVSASGRGHKTNRSMSRGVVGDSGSSGSAQSGDRKSKGCICGLLEVPGCCSGGCADCICNQLEIAGNGRQF